MLKLLIELIIELKYQPVMLKMVELTRWEILGIKLLSGTTQRFLVTYLGFQIKIIWSK